MTYSKKVQKPGKQLLRAYVALKAGDNGKAKRLFASIEDSKGLDLSMEGISRAMLQMKANEERVIEEDDILDATELDDESLDELDDDDNDLDFDDDDDDDLEETDLDGDDDFDEDEEETVEVPASVARYFNLA